MSIVDRGKNSKLSCYFNLRLWLKTSKSPAGRMKSKSSWKTRLFRELKSDLSFPFRLSDAVEQQRRSALRNVIGVSRRERRFRFRRRRRRTPGLWVRRKVVGQVEVWRGWVRVPGGRTRRPWDEKRGPEWWEFHV